LLSNGTPQSYCNHLGHGKQFPSPITFASRIKIGQGTDASCTWLQKVNFPDINFESAEKHIFISDPDGDGSPSPM
jgi:hypothetical protein